VIGVGIAHGAITFLNALPTGIGAAAGIELPATATVELRDAEARTIEVHAESDSPLVVASAEAALQAWAPDRPLRAQVRVRSEVPVAKGLKSSSAVGTAVVRAVAAGLGVVPPDDHVASIAADVAQRIGLSATGAFDDALASIEPGVQVTDNPARKRIRTDPVDPAWAVVIWVPEGLHAPSATVRERFATAAPDAAAAEAAARRGDPLAAMTLNTAIVERIMGYEYGAIRAQLRAAGALGAGVSGMGPALAAIARPADCDAVRQTFPTGEGSVVITRFVRAAPTPTGGTG